MNQQNKTVPTENSVQEFINSLPNAKQVHESNTLISLMSKISGCAPKMWGPSIIGFDSYHYIYDSGREGDMCVIGFSPRKNEFSLYLVDGISKYEDELQRLGKHRIGKACLYIKKLSDIDLSVLETIIQRSYSYTKSQSGNMHRAQ